MEPAARRLSSVPWPQPDSLPETPGPGQTRRESRPSSAMQRETGAFWREGMTPSGPGSDVPAPPRPGLIPCGVEPSHGLGSSITHGKEP
jgi:hypothetical protein